MLAIYWCATVVLLMCAVSFVVPPLWVAHRTYSCVAIIFLCGFSYGLYLKFGAAAQLSSYYNKDSVQQRKDVKKIRPLYARLQRELVKNKLNLDLDAENIELILYFANIHSRLQQGTLEPDIQNLLQAVLNVMPQQVTALNLLAIHAYKSKNYNQAIGCWQKILQQFTGDMRGTQIEKALTDQIIDAQKKLHIFESRQTK